MISAEDRPIFPLPLTDAGFPALAELVADAVLGVPAIDPIPLVGDIFKNCTFVVSKWVGLIVVVVVEDQAVGPRLGDGRSIYKPDAPKPAGWLQIDPRFEEDTISIRPLRRRTLTTVFFPFSDVL